MKHIFVFILTAAMAFGMSARKLELQGNSRLVSQTSLSKLNVRKTVPCVKAGNLRAAEDTADDYSVEGEYNIYIEDVYFDDSKGDFTDDCTVSL